MGGLIFSILVTMVGGLFRGLISFLMLAAVLGTILTRDMHGKSLLDRGLARFAWHRAVRSGAHLYKSGPLGWAPWGTHQLPGIAASLRLSEHADAYGRRFALVHAPHASTFTVVVAAEPDGASLVDPEQIDMWVADWGNWLANLADEPGIEACSVTIETAPDTGHRLRQEVLTNMDPDAPPFARAVLNDVMRSYPSGCSTVKAYVALTFSADNTATGKKRNADEVGRDLAARLPSLTSELAATGAGSSRLLAAADVCELVRVAYAPGTATVINQAHAAGEETGLEWSDVGPSAAKAEWDGYRHDEAYSTTWSMTVAPRSNVPSSVLARLLAPHREIARKRVTLLYRPIDAGKAAAIVESDLRAAQFRASSTSKPTARDALATRSAAATAAEEASGAGLVNFGMLVTATVLDVERIAEARAAVDNLAATARLKLRPVYGAQPAAFVAALPLGVVLSKHLNIPASMRSRL